MADLLLELLSEEIPARMQARAAADLQRLVTERLGAAGLPPSGAAAFVTPRRLALLVEGLPPEQPDVVEERKGPRVGSPEKAVEGFLRAAGLSGIDQAEARDTGKGVFYFAVQHRKGQATAEVLPSLLAEAVLALPWPKSMTWGAYGLRWVRPLHSVLCLYDGDVVPLAVGHLIAGDSTRGHRFMARGAFAVRSFAEYRERLRSACVMLDPAERREVIRSEAERLAAGEGFVPLEDGPLLAEVAGLVEWPVVLAGRIDEAFLSLPREVLTTSMRSHQKYFSLQRPDGSLAPRFVMVANLAAKDGGRQIVAGNERVLRARLSDAQFFWDQDRNAPLESRVPALADVVFHARLGSIAAKVDRMQDLAAALAAAIPGADPGLCRRAALLAKADLTTGMVGEFPELQGIMGRYYALHDGENAEVADAIADHYSPLGPDDRCPTAPVSVAVALADKLDTLAGFFLIGEKPTGSKDPFALRRAALGAIRLILENRLRLPLIDYLAKALGSMERPGAAPAAGEQTRPGWSRVAPAPIWELLDFLADRLKVHLREQGVRHDLVSAVFALGDGDDLVRLMARVEALGELLASEDGANLLVAYRRAANILRIEEKKDATTYDGRPDTRLLAAPEEASLHERLNAVAEHASAALAGDDFRLACKVLAGLRAPVDAFFDAVTVNADDAELRANRLRLLAQIRAELDRLADFSKIEG